VISRILLFYNIKIHWRCRKDKHSDLLPFTTVRVSLSQVEWQPSFVDFPHPTEFPTHGRFVALEALTAIQLAAIGVTPRPLDSFDFE
jgi:hypothetical protein